VRRPHYSDEWPASWKLSYNYDLLEVYGAPTSKGYSNAYDNRRRHTIELIGKVAAPGAKILDVAAAQGNFSIALAELGYEVTWNDLRGDLADYARLKQDRGVIHYVPGNILELSPGEGFDVVLIAEVIEHVAHPDDFLKLVSRLAKPGGHVVMSTPNGGYFLNTLPRFTDCPDPSRFEAVQFQPNSDGHIFLLHADEIESLAGSSGLIAKEIRLFSNPLTNGHLKLGPLLNLLPRGMVGRLEAATALLPLRLQKRIHTGMAVLLARAA
jgi:2-polyprenyl-6-hydroxyphenyl methylase/3-demethylubiquinone-9 3-methyltransferase